MNEQNSGKGDDEGGGSSIESESSDGLGTESSKYDVEADRASSKPSSSSNKSESSDGLYTESSSTKDDGEGRGGFDRASAKPSSSFNKKATAHKRDEKAKYKKNPNVPKRKTDDVPKIVPGYTANAKTTGLDMERQPVQAPTSAAVAAAMATSYPGTMHQRNLPSSVNAPRVAAAAPAPSHHGQSNSASTDDVVQQATRQALQTAMLLQLLQQVRGPNFGMSNEQQATTQQASQPSPVRFTNPQQSQPQLDNSLQAAAQWALSRLQQQGGSVQNTNVEEETKSNGPMGSAGSASNNAFAGQFGGHGQNGLPLGMLGPLLSVSLNGTASSEIPHRISPNPAPSPPPQAVTNEQAAMLGRLVLASFQNQQQQQSNVNPQGGRVGIPQAAATAAPAPPPPSQQANQNLNIFTNLATQGGFSAAGLPANALSSLLDPTAMLRMAMQTLQQHQQAQQAQQQQPQPQQAQQQQQPQQQQAPAPAETIQLLALTHLFMAPPSDESNNNQGNDSNRPNQGS